MAALFWAAIIAGLGPIGKSKSMSKSEGENKSKSKKTLFNIGQCEQYNISSHLSASRLTAPGHYLDQCWLIIGKVQRQLIVGLRPVNERRRYKVTPSLVGWT